MAAMPDDLVELYHLVLANHDEPLRWKMSRRLWDAIAARADDYAIEDPSADRARLLDLPVEVIDDDDPAPILTIRQDGQEQAIPVLGPMQEI